MAVNPIFEPPSGPHAVYCALLERGQLEVDVAQEHAAKRLESLYHELLTYTEANRGLKAWIRRLRQTGPATPQGLYLWGGVGRGKTTLMDLFYDCLPFDAKFRTHFHRFMHQIHADLMELRGSRAPLAAVADRYAERTRVICFDEFEVTDIGDAMILTGLLEALFERGVVLVATSNTPPQRLYEHGLQRARFLPAIALIQRHTDVVQLGGSLDYRPRRLDRASVYHVPADAASNQSMMDLMREIAGEEPSLAGTMEIQGRHIPLVAQAPDVVWFEFEHIGEAPRGKGDYIEIARRFGTVLISNVPQMTGKNDQARRFISLVDEFYDRSIKLVISAAAEPYGLYTGKRLRHEFARTSSRLIEMQSQHYLSGLRLGAGQSRIWSTPATLQKNLESLR